MFRRGGGVSARNNGIVSGFDEMPRQGFAPENEERVAGTDDMLRTLGWDQVANETRAGAPSSAPRRPPARAVPADRPAPAPRARGTSAARPSPRATLRRAGTYMNATVLCGSRLHVAGPLFARDVGTHRS